MFIHVALWFYTLHSFFSIFLTFPSGISPEKCQRLKAKAMQLSGTLLSISFSLSFELCLLNKTVCVCGDPAPTGTVQMRPRPKRVGSMELTLSESHVSQVMVLHWLCRMSEKTVPILCATLRRLIGGTCFWTLLHTQSWKQNVCLSYDTLVIQSCRTQTWSCVYATFSP